MTDIALQGGTHYAFNCSTEQLKVTNPRKKRAKVKNEGTMKTKARKEGVKVKAKMEKKRMAEDEEEKDDGIEPRAKWRRG